ncbi:hypothetical protein, partial [Leptospira borgpetersenii]|uniref:hypothetical protein n=1 Tax=Leptospira borgpetersenii TaxID=174 RepID=UPI001E3389DD
SVPVAPSAKIQRNSKSTNEQLCVGSSRPISQDSKKLKIHQRTTLCRFQSPHQPRFKETQNPPTNNSVSVPVAPSAKIQRNSKSTNEQLCVGSSRPIRYILT